MEVMMGKIWLGLSWSKVSLLIIIGTTIAALLPPPAMSKNQRDYSFPVAGWQKKSFGGISNSSVLLAGHKSKGNLSSEEQERLERNLQEWKSLPPENRKVLRHRMEQWRELPPEERKLYQQRFRQLQQLPPEQQKRIREKLERLDRLSPQEQEELRRIFPPPER
jgi:hypothetical protein